MKKSKVYYVLLFIVILVTLLMIFPFVWTIVMSFKTDNDIINAPLALPKVWNFDNYVRALKTLNIFAMYKNTFIVVVTTQIVSLVITFMSSFAICRMKFQNRKIKNLLYTYYLLGISVPEITVLGGGAKGRTWCEIMSDVFQTNLLIPDLLEEAGAMGAAVNGGVGVGLYKNYSAIQSFIKIKDRIQPSKENLEIYQETKAKFNEYYNSLKRAFG